METLSNGGARNINKITLLEELLKDKPLVRLETLNGLKPELLEMAHGNCSSLLEVTHLRLRKLFVSNAAVANLDGIISVGGLGLDLGDDVSFSETHNSDRNDLAVGLEEAHHSELGSHNSNAGLHAHDGDTHPLLVLGVAEQKKVRVALRHQWRWAEERRRKERVVLHC